jgi:hypothetical protein
MPFALLLQTTMKPITDAADLLAPWERLAFLEMQMLERARSTFLVRWFGADTPISGLSVNIAIANLAELQNRLGIVGQANRGLSGVPTGPGGPGLLEPLAGLAGGLAGAMFSPTASMALVAVAARVKQSVVLAVVATLNWFAVGVLGTAVGTAIVGLLIVPIAVAYGISTSRPGYLGLIAAVGPALIALRHFWDAVTDPRGRHVHPLIAAALRAGDALAGLMPFLLAAFAVAVTYIGPTLESLGNQFVALAGLGNAMVDMFKAITGDLSDRLDTLTGPRGVTASLHGVFDALRASFSRTGRWLVTTWGLVVRLMVASGAVVEAALHSWGVTAGPQVRALTTGHPLIAAMRRFADQLGIVADAWKHSARPAKAAASSSPGVLGRLLATVSVPTPPFPTAPAIPPFAIAHSDPAGAVADAARMLIAADRLAPGLIPNPVALDQASEAVLQAARRPGGVFAGRIAALRHSVSSAERERRAQSARDVDAYRTMTERLANPVMITQFSRIDSLLARVHDAITSEDTAHHLPVRSLDDRPVLRPVIGRLRVRVAPGGDRALADAWTTLLRTRLDAQARIAPVGG